MTDLFQPIASLPIPSAAVAIGAHPDDIEFNAGSTLAKWARHGCISHMVILTDGSKGSWDEGKSQADLVASRKEEALLAAGALGVGASHTYFLGQVDGELVATREIVVEVARIIRLAKAEVVIGHDPWKRYRLHPDHRAAGFITTDAIVWARDPHFPIPGSPAHHRPSHLLLFEADEVDHVEDCSGFEEQKATSLLQHKSQYLSTMGINEDDPSTLVRFKEWLQEDLREKGSLAGFAAGEAFKRVSQL